jgi:DNA polymerase III epsilon subunit-like protein
MEMARYLSVDIETTGLDPETCDILEFGAVIDTISPDGATVPVEQLPSFHAYLARDSYRGEPYALSMHPAIFRRIAVRQEGFRYLAPERLGFEFRNWLIDQGFPLPEGKTRVKVQCAGKNFAGFDRAFLAKLDGFLDYIELAHRSFDPGTLYFDPRTDKAIPSTEECLKRAGLDATVAHTAVEDARNVVRLLRYKWWPS